MISDAIENKQGGAIIVDKIQQWLVERQAVYSLFGALYRGDVSAGLHFLKDTDLLQKFAQNLDSVLAASAKELIKEIKAYEDDNGYQKMLRGDYNRLFWGPDHILVPPWESIYCTKEKLLFGKSEIAVRRYYQLFGLKVNDREPADHLSIELSFMARLCAIGISDAKRIFTVLENQKNFLEDHLSQWVPILADEVLNKAKTTFWSALTVFVYRWLENDLSEVKKVIKIRQRIVRKLSILVKGNRGC